MIRKATLADLPGIMICINDAKKFLKASGSSQWNGTNNYPAEEDMLQDINNDALYVNIKNGDIAGVAAFAGFEPDYEKIKNGNWLTNTKDYLTVHRIAVSNKFRGTGVGRELLTYSFEYARKNKLKSVRIDTHPKNKIMQGLVTSLDFTNCGMVVYQHIEIEPERLVYEKIV